MVNNFMISHPDEGQCYFQCISLPPLQSCSLHLPQVCELPGPSLPSHCLIYSWPLILKAFAGRNLPSPNMLGEEGLWELRGFCHFCILNSLRYFFPSLGWFSSTHHQDAWLLKRDLHNLYRHSSQVHGASREEVVLSARGFTLNTPTTLESCSSWLDGQ